MVLVYRIQYDCILCKGVVHICQNTYTRSAPWNCPHVSILIFWSWNTKRAWGCSHKISQGHPSSHRISREHSRARTLSMTCFVSKEENLDALSVLGKPSPKRACKLPTLQVFNLPNFNQLALTAQG